MGRQSADELGASGFDAWYRGEFDPIGSQVPRAKGLVPWDIGAPQPAVVALERSGQFRSDVLDIGCGPGDNAHFLARQGYSVVGLDGSSAAVERARAQVWPGEDITFAVADAADLTGYESRFSTILDSGLLHSLGSEQQAAYPTAIHRAAVPGATLHLFCFSDVAPEVFPAPGGLSEAQLRSALEPFWDITDLDHGTNLVSAFTPDVVERVTGTSPEGLDTDEHGRVRAPVWTVRAKRK